MTASAVQVANAAAEHGFTVLNHDINGWTVALIVAIIAAFIYEAAMAMTKLVTLRIPFLVLQIARLSTPEKSRAALYREWKAELWAVLRGRGLWIVRFYRGMAFALPLAIYGARSTARASRASRRRRKLSPVQQGILAGVAASVPYMVTMFLVAFLHLSWWFVAAGMTTSLALAYWYGARRRKAARQRR